MSTGQFSSNRTYNAALDDGLAAAARVLEREVAEPAEAARLLIAICKEVNENWRRKVRRDRIKGNP
jgi:hypothetical protein